MPMVISINSSVRGWSKRWIIGASALTLVIGTAYVVSRIADTPAAPPIPGVTVCSTPPVGMTRIGEEPGYQFDILKRDFSVKEDSGVPDTLEDYPRRAFAIRHMRGTSVLSISFGERHMKAMATDPVRVISSHVEQRRLVDARGNQVGEDSWGFLNTGERWRQLRLFKGAVVAKYGFVDKKQAALFDRIINSVCLTP